MNTKTRLLNGCDTEAMARSLTMNEAQRILREKFNVNALEGSVLSKAEQEETFKDIWVDFMSRRSAALYVLVR